jgi:hypothetical protein
MALPTTNYANQPNKPYYPGTGAAGQGGVVNQETLQSAIPQGLTKAGIVNNGNVRAGFNAAGVPKNNSGPNSAGAPRDLDFPEYYEPLT